jgi:nitroreductase
MELFEAINRRHSYRGDFTDARVPEEDLRKIVQAGIQAPSGRNEQTTSFIVVDDPELLSRIAEVIGKPFCRSAPAMIVCVSDPRPVFKGMSFAAEDRAAAVENMLLAVTALGYATVWLDGVLKSENRAETIAEMLGVPDSLEISIILPIGVPAEKGSQKEKLPFEQRASFNRFPEK